MNQSEVAHIREKIRLEYEASRRPFNGFTPTGRHEFITRRQEHIEACFNQLTRHMPPDEAMMLLLQVEQQVYQSDKSS